jgi:hypothetical protein
VRTAIFDVNSDIVDVYNNEDLKMDVYVYVYVYVRNMSSSTKK